MKEVMDTLREFSDVVISLMQMRYFIEEKPREIKPREEKLAQMETMVTTLNDEIVDLSRKIGMIDVELAEARMQHKKYEHQQMQIRKPKEFEALNAEIYAVKQRIDELNKDKKDIERKVEEKSKNLDEINPRYSHEKELIEQERLEIAAKVEEMKPQYEELTMKKDALANMLPADIKVSVLAMEKNTRYKNGIVAEVNKNMCGGCKVALPPQLVADVRRAKAIKKCPYCGRLLYWQE